MKLFDAFVVCFAGAVVAREYGLPCIVNVQHATQLLQTGDHINVDGATGTINKLEDVTE